MKQAKVNLKELYNEEYKFLDENGLVFEVPVEGSLGLLAEGYKGLIALRKKRKEEGYTIKNIILKQESQKEADGKK